MGKKITIAIIITVFMINMLIPNFIFAWDGVGDFKDVVTGPIDFESIMKKGKATVKPDSGEERIEEIKETSSVGNTVLSAVTTLLLIPAKTISTVLSIFVFSFQETEVNGYEMEITHPFTIENLVMGKYTIFNIDNIFDTAESTNTTVQSIKENVTIWYYTLRNVAATMSLLILLYIGIRMAVSTMSTEQAKYKKMLMSWITSMIILFIMHYIAIFFMELQVQIIRIFKQFTLGNTGFEEAIIVNTWNLLLNADGIYDKVGLIIVYYVILYYQLKFAFLYIKRTLSVSFLITIAPLVTVTYSIDKAGDNKAQAFATWLKELIIHIFIQVLHAIIYIVFIFSAANIVKEVPLLGILFLMALSRAEKLVRKTFSVGGEGIAEINPLKKLAGK